MTRFSIRHVTTYEYSAEVASSQSRLHVIPRATPSQHVESAVLHSDPPASDRAASVDVFGNVTTYLAVETPHRRWSVTCESVVDAYPALVPSIDITWEQATIACGHVTFPLDAIEMSLGSTHVPLDDALATYADPSFPSGGNLQRGVLQLTERIYQEFTFDPTATEVSTPILSVLQERRGVCQDFAHLMIGCLRSLGLAARYVSGYLETEAPPGMVRLVGADASHAWVSVYAPGFGWLDFDPTNGTIPGGRHIIVAWGRDYADVAPSRGVVFGPPSTQTLHVAVDVARLER